MNYTYVMWIICVCLLVVALWQTLRSYKFLNKISILTKELDKITKPEEDKEKLIEEYLNKAGEIASNESTVPDYIGKSTETPETVAIEKLAGEVFVKGAAEWEHQVETAGSVALANVHKKIDVAIDKMHQKLENGEPVMDKEVKQIDELISKRNSAGSKNNKKRNKSKDKKNKELVQAGTGTGHHVAVAVKKQTKKNKKHDELAPRNKRVAKKVKDGKEA